MHSAPSSAETKSRRRRDSRPADPRESVQALLPCGLTMPSSIAGLAALGPASRLRSNPILIVASGAAWPGPFGDGLPSGHGSRPAGRDGGDGRGVAGRPRRPGRPGRRGGAARRAWRSWRRSRSGRSVGSPWRRLRCVEEARPDQPRKSRSSLKRGGSPISLHEPFASQCNGSTSFRAAFRIRGTSRV